MLVFVENSRKSTFYKLLHIDLMGQSRSCYRVFAVVVSQVAVLEVVEELESLPDDGPTLLVLSYKWVYLHTPHNMQIHRCT